jgi:hypothetical protein
MLLETISNNIFFVIKNTWLYYIMLKNKILYAVLINISGVSQSIQKNDVLLRSLKKTKLI